MSDNPTYVPIQAISLGTSQANFSFTNIPQQYTDLVLHIYGRDNYASSADVLATYINGSTANIYSNTNLTIADTTYPGRASNTTGITGGYVSGNSGDSNMYGSTVMHFMNYSNTTGYKTVYLRGAGDYNSTSAGANQVLFGSFKTTAPITSIQVSPGNGTLFLSGSQATLYGIEAAPITVRTSPKASGGNISTDGVHWYHSFLSSDTFRPHIDLTADILVVAGGGSGGGSGPTGASRGGGGGGAGGILGFASQSLTANTNYTCTVGSGGTANYSTFGNGNSGSNSQFASLTAAVGGGFGASQSPNTAGNGGSGGGGGNGGTAGSATSGQGNAGGNGGAVTGNYTGGGGGGYLGAGTAGSNNAAGVGGTGSNSVANIGNVALWLATTGTGHMNAIGGGGGGGTWQGGTAGQGGAGGGGNGGTVSSNTPGMPGRVGTGGGGGGGSYQSALSSGGAGGSGLIIVRYPV